MLNIKVTTNLRGVENFKIGFRNGLQPNSAGPLSVMFKRWAIRFRTFIQRRFNQYSRGKGDWPDLSQKTKDRRRKGRKKSKNAGSFSILRDTNTLYLATNPQFSNLPGQLEDRKFSLVIVGYGGPQKHKSGKMTVGQLAEVHQLGLGKGLPERGIIVDPDIRTRRQIRNDARDAVNALIAETGAG